MDGGRDGEKETYGRREGWRDGREELLKGTMDGRIYGGKEGLKDR